MGTQEERALVGAGWERASAGSQCSLQQQIAHGPGSWTLGGSAGGLGRQECPTTEANGASAGWKGSPGGERLEVALGCSSQGDSTGEALQAVEGLKKDRSW